MGFLSFGSMCGSGVWFLDLYLLFVVGLLVPKFSGRGFAIVLEGVVCVRWEDGVCFGWEGGVCFGSI